MSFPAQSTLARFYRSIIVANNGRSAEERGFKCLVAVHLLIKMDGNATKVGTPTLCGRADDAAGTSQCKMHNHSFAQDDGHDLISIHTAVIVENMNFNPYPKTFQTTGEELSTPADGYSPGVYA